MSVWNIFKGKICHNTRGCVGTVLAVKLLWLFYAIFQGLLENLCFKELWQRCFESGFRLSTGLTWLPACYYCRVVQGKPIGGCSSAIRPVDKDWRAYWIVKLKRDRVLAVVQLGNIVLQIWCFFLFCSLCR